MSVLFSWWLVSEGLGVAVLPLTTVVFANLQDRGWGLARPFGLLLLGWLVWFPLTLVHALPYSQGWIIGTCVVLVLGNAALLTVPAVRARLRLLVVQQWGYLLASEVVFAGALALMGWLRSFTPGVVDQEKFMDVAFISSIWRAPHLPPPDPWLAGETINYYYFGHFLMATLAKLLGTIPAVAFNASVALVFALTASAVFAVATNLVATARRARGQSLIRCAPFGVVSVLLVLILGNLNAAQEWWQTAVAQVAQAPATLSNPWAWWFHPALWLQYNWWNPSRVVPHTINEFPAFSFILSDLHAHVLALPFAALALGVALNLLLAQGDGVRAFGAGAWGITALLCSALVLGALYAINGWDLPTYLGLAVLALGIQQWISHARRWSALFVVEFAIAAMLLVALAILLFVPFYMGYTSPAEGIGLVMPRGASSPIGDVVAIFGLPLFLVGTLLLVRLVQALAPRLAPAPHIEWEAHTAFVSDRLAPGRLAAGVLLGGGAALVIVYTALTAGFTRWTLLWSLALLAGCAVLVLRQLAPGAGTPATDERTVRHRDLAELFIWCLVGTAAALVAVCELVYLRDLFDGGLDFRMNTVFKFYYQVWLLLGIVGGPVLASLLQLARGQVAWLFAPPAALPVKWANVPDSLDMEEAGVATPAAPEAVLAVGHSALRAPGALIEPAPPDSIGPRSDRATGWPTRRPPQQRGDSVVRTRDMRWNWLGVGGMLIYAAALLVLLAAAAVYPVQASAARTANFSLPRTLDGTAYMATDSVNHGDAAAIAWLNDPAHVTGNPVIVEASGGEYSHFDRVSAFTGLPTILGWSLHEWQWRATWLVEPQHAGELDRRQADINTIYTSQDPTLVLATLARYHVRYVYVGEAEREAYPGTNLEHFGGYMRVVYQSQGVTIYQVP